MNYQQKNLLAFLLLFNSDQTGYKISFLRRNKNKKKSKGSLVKKSHLLKVFLGFQLK